MVPAKPTVCHRVVNFVRNGPVGLSRCYVTAPLGSVHGMISYYVVVGGVFPINTYNNNT